jgi:hypothetical protein
MVGTCGSTVGKGHNPNLQADVEAVIGNNWSALGENVGCGADVDSLDAALLASPPHYANIVDTRWNYVGIGVTVDGQGRLWVVFDFVQATTALATVGPPPPATTLEALVIADDNTAYVSTFNSDGTWRGRTQLAGGDGWTYRILSNASNIDRRDPTLEAIGIADDNTAWLHRFNSDGTWRGRTQLAGGNGWDYRTVTGASNVDTRDPSLEAIVVADDGTAYLTRFNSDGTWRGRTQLAGGNGWDYRTVTGASNVDTRDPSLEAIVVADDGTAYLTRFNSDGTWRGRTQLAGGNGWDYRIVTAASDLIS